MVKLKKAIVELRVGQKITFSDREGYVKSGIIKDIWSEGGSKEGWQIYLEPTRKYKDEDLDEPRKYELEIEEEEEEVKS